MKLVHVVRHSYLRIWGGEEKYLDDDDVDLVEERVLDFVVVGFAAVSEHLFKNEHLHFVARFWGDQAPFLLDLLLEDFEGEKLGLVVLAELKYEVDFGPEFRVGLEFCPDFVAKLDLGMGRGEYDLYVFGAGALSDDVEGESFLLVEGRTAVEEQHASLLKHLEFTHIF